jgi:DNA-binding FadR family transcriptional regulator
VLSGNSYLATLLEPLWDAIDQALAKALLRRSWSADDARRVSGEHRKIYDGLAAADPDLAAFAMETHLRGLIARMFDDTPAAI